MARGLMSFRFRSPIDFVGNKPGRTHPEARLPKQAPRRKNKCKAEWCRDLASRPVFSKPRDSELYYEEGPGNQERRGPWCFPDKTKT